MADEPSDPPPVLDEGPAGTSQVKLKEPAATTTPGQEEDNSAPDIPAPVIPPPALPPSVLPPSAEEEEGVCFHTHIIHYSHFHLEAASVVSCCL